MAKVKKIHVIRAIDGSGGILSAIAKKLNISWATVRNYIENYNLQPYIDEEKESVLDLCESKLIQNIDDNDNQAIFYYLNNRGKSRGYNAPVKIDNISSDGSMSPINVIVSSDKAKTEVEKLINNEDD